MRKIFALLLTGMAGFILAGCASTPNTYSNADQSVDLTQFRTYGFFENLSTDKEQYQSLVSNFLKVAVAQEMYRRGLEHSQDPQILLNFYINTEEKIRTRTTPTMGAYYGYRDPFYEPWAGYGGYETRVDQYTEGTLHIDIVDAESKKLVWEGAIVGRIRDEDVKNMEATIDEAVAAVMANYPVLPTGSAEN
jgi:hypothetical protein